MDHLMKYASFLNPAGAATWGSVADGTVTDLGPTGAGVADSLRAAIEACSLGNPSQAGAPTYDEDSTTFLPVIPNPDKIICVGTNYAAHQAESGIAPKIPPIFTRFADTQIGHLQPALMPAESEQFDWEGELAVVIGAEADHVTAGDAWSKVAGVAIYNDLSARDWQRKSGQWTPGKNFPGTGAFGPYFVPVSEFTDIEARKLVTRVNGEVRQKAVLGDMIYDVPKLIEFISTWTVLRPGDVIVTGTPGGVGLFMDPPTFLRDGDVVEVEIDGLGVLRNTVEVATR
jgi:2-keto-4-pentenoate hydratase/2-oxohepta-3-ene-1,7-dioic acid hydratase in catechol pathway